jgi:hypothetical protein
MHDDDLARLHAEAEQVRETVKELAANLGMFYRSLLAEGFPAEDAAELVRMMLLQWVAGDDDSA